MEPGRLHADLATQLGARRRADGGFPVGVGGPAEVEPTAVAALALGDPSARAWLSRRQGDDGSLWEARDRPTSPSLAALAAIALGAGAAARRAVAFAVQSRAVPLPRAPDQDARIAWGWTTEDRAFVEPTSRVLLAVKIVTPDDRVVRAEALRSLEAGRCADGGWNYGTPAVFGTSLRSYAQTTAIALMALQGERDAVTEPAIGVLRRRWVEEPGGLTVAQAIVALRLHGEDVSPLDAALAEAAGRGFFLERTTALAWATLASAPDSVIDALRPAS